MIRLIRYVMAILAVLIALLLGLCWLTGIVHADPYVHGPPAATRPEVHRQIR